MRSRRVLAALAALGTLGTPGPCAAQGTIRVGEINSFSGIGAPFTGPYRQAIEMAVEEVNAKGGVLGRKVEVLFRDDKGQPAEAVKHAQELVANEKVALIAGTFLSNVGLAVSDWAKQNKALFVAAEPLTEALTWAKGHDHVFRVRPNTYEQGRMLAEKAAKLKYTKWAAIGPNYEYGKRAWETFRDRLKELRPEAQTVGEHWPTLGKIEPSQFVTAILGESPDALYVSLYGSDWIAFVREADKRGLFKKMFVVGILLGEPEYIDPLKLEAPEGMLVTGYPWYDLQLPAHKEFVAKFTKRTDKNPVLGSLVGYITYLSIAEAIRKAGSTDTDKLVAAFRGLKVETPIGPISFRASDGQSTMGAWVGLAGLGVEVALLRRVYRAPELYQLLLTFALVLVVADVVKLFWGSENLTGPAAPGLAGSVEIAGQLFPTYDLALIGLGPLVATGLWWLFYRTRWGVLIRAATQDREMVAVLGVDQARLFTSVFVLGSFLAGLGGALQVPRQALTNVMDASIITEAFVVVVVGGMGSVPGALLAAALIGVIDAFGVLVLPRASLVVPFVVMAVVLIVRPWGLLGRPEVQQRTAGGAIVTAGTVRVPPRWVAAVLAALLAVPPFLPTFHVWVLVEILAFALFAASLHLLMGTGGMVSFGHAASFGLGAYGAALLVTWTKAPMLPAFAAAPLAAAVGAALYGYFCVRLSSIYFALLTLSFAQIV